jgi:hypothetical protein
MRKHHQRLFVGVAATPRLSSRSSSRTAAAWDVDKRQQLVVVDERRHPYVAGATRPFGGHRRPSSFTICENVDVRFDASLLKSSFGV